MQRLALRLPRARHPVLARARLVAVRIVRRLLRGVPQAHQAHVDLAQRVRESGEW